MSEGFNGGYESAVRETAGRFFQTVSAAINQNAIESQQYQSQPAGTECLFGDGHIEFLKSRFIGFSEDDIYTLQDTDVYQGCEVPSCETDFFLAP